MTALASLTGPAGHVFDDAGLVARVRAGDDRAFDSLFRRYQPKIAAFVRSKVHDHGRAEDITQEVFLSALRRLRATDAEIAFKPWIYEIARNACIDAWRRSRNTDEVSFDERDALGADDQGRLAHPGLTPDSAVDVKLAFDSLRGALGGLSPSHHEILVMFEFEGLSYREIGDRLGMSRASVESSLFRARRQLVQEHEELVSGKRCRTVQASIDCHGGRALGVREELRMARHVAHCQPCRRYAWIAGIDLDRVRRPSVAARIAAWLPWPLFGRRRASVDVAEIPAAAQPAPLANAAQWSSSAVAALDPAAASGLAKLVATAATVAVASLGAGAAIHERGAIKDLLGSGPAAERPAAARPGAPAPGTSTPAGGVGPLASHPMAAGEPAPGGGPSGAGLLPGASRKSTASGPQDPADESRTPLASAPNAAGGGRKLTTTTTSSPGRQGTTDVGTTTAGGLPSLPSAPATAPTTNGATAGGGAATVPSAPVSRPQAPSAPSPDDVTGQAGGIDFGAPAAPSPTAVGTPDPSKPGSTSATATETSPSATAGRLAP